MKKIGKYKICGLLGRGGMGKVYKVELPVTGNIAALKLLDPNPLLLDLMGAGAIRKLFVSEAVTMASLRHPNIVQIWDYDDTQDKPFYTMDYYCNNLGIIIGETYKTERPSRIIKVDRAIEYTRQTLSGLARLHYAGIIHRDIKPYNILLSDDDIAKICDFGLSKLRGEAFTGPSNLNVGSPWYAAPEQETDPDRVDFSADIYSVGIMLHRMVTGNLPTKEFQTPSTFNPDLDEKWDTFIKKAISPKARDRFVNAEEMLNALDELHQHWKNKIEKTCRLPGEHSAGRKRPKSQNSAKTVRLRKKPVKIRPRQAKTHFSTDHLWRPLNFIQNEFNIYNKDTVADTATGLLWQHAGTNYPMNWDQARLYIEKLNETLFADRSSWRLPTVDELMSILTETPHGEAFCIEPVFDQKQKWLWSSDRRSFTAAWYVSVELGFVAWQDFTGYCHVKAVCEE